MTDWCKDPAWLSHFGSFLIVMVAMLAGAPAQCQNGSYEKEKKAYQICMDGSQQNATGNYSQARQTLSAAVGLDPSSYSGYLHKQLALSCQGLKTMRGKLVNSGRQCAIARTTTDWAMTWQFVITMPGKVTKPSTP
ncbi:MAG: hypothetical protein IPP57_20215 [Candidatus Obscuribacter sp.]|nr:hypothetical protein [Candidatus Obscuribacter sp.]